MSGSRRLPEYTSQVNLRSAGSPRVGASIEGAAAAASRPSWTDAFGRAAEVFSGFARERAREAEAGRVADMAELGRNAVELDEEGRPRAPALRPNDSAANRAWNVAVTQSYEDATEQHWASRFVQERERFRDDPEGFRRWAAGTVEGAAGEMDPRFAGRIGNRLNALAEGHYRALVSDGQQRRAGLARNDWFAQQGIIAEEVGRLALTGQENTPAFADARARLDRHLAAGQAAGHVSEEGVRLAREQVAGNAVAFGIAGRAEDIARREGPEAARRWLENSLSDPRLAAAGDAAVREARAAANRRLAMFDHERSVARGELTETLRTVHTSISAGVQVPASRLDDYARRAEAAGMRGEAAQFRAIATIQGEVAGYARSPLPALLDALEGTRSGDPEDRATSARATVLRGMVEERVRALRDDPVGYADGTEEVRAVAARVQRGEATQADLVRARDEVLRANGLDPSFHRVLSRPQAQAVVDRVRDAPLSEASAALVDTFAAYGPGLRWRVWNDLKAAGIRADLRPAALMLASPGGQAAAANYLAAVREGDEALNRPLTTDTRQRIGDEVHKVMRDLRGTFTGTGFDAELAADTERAVDTLARFYARTMTPAEAARRARAEVVDGAVEVVEWNNARLRIPRGVQFDRAEFRRSLEGMGRSMEEVQFRLPPGAVSPELTGDEAQAAYRSSLRNSGVWRTDQDGMGAWMHDGTGRPVFVVQDGRAVPYRVRFDENFRSPAVLEGGNYATVRRLAAADGVDASLAAALARAENSGRTSGTSSAGALGLMQVMPDTAREVARELGIPFDEARLNTDPEYNARLGVRYLRNMLARYGGDQTLAVAAYNAGPGTVDDWLNGGRATLPNETVRHVARVLDGNGVALLMAARQRRGAGGNRAGLAPGAGGWPQQ